MRTTQEIENYIPVLAKLLGFENQPKWVVIRFMINVSLSIDNEIDVAIPKFDGKEYNLAQITGYGKENEDVSAIYEKMFERFDDELINNKKEFETKLEYHLLRGYSILHSSIKSRSDIYDFLIQEFVNASES